MLASDEKGRLEERSESVVVLGHNLLWVEERLALFKRKFYCPVACRNDVGCFGSTDSCGSNPSVIWSSKFASSITLSYGATSAAMLTNWRSWDRITVSS